MIAPWLRHGGALIAAQAAYGGQDWLDLSTGINPRPWPVAAAGPVDWHRLPDAAAVAVLEQAAATAFGADPACVCAVAGSELALRLVGSLLEGPAWHVAPGYGTHAEALAGSGALDADRLALADGATLLLANPANPDGRLLPRPALLDLLDRRGSGWLLVDEAFADAAPGPSVAAEVRTERRLVVFRSFGKFFGLAGVRLGFVVGPPALLGRLRRLLGAWPVSAAAIAFGTAAYREDRWIATTRNALAAGAAALDACLARHGLVARGSCPLFRLVETADAAGLFDTLARQAILTRPFAKEPSWLRFGLPADEVALDRLDSALARG